MKQAALRQTGGSQAVVKQCESWMGGESAYIFEMVPLPPQLMIYNVEEMRVRMS